MYRSKQINVKTKLLITLFFALIMQFTTAQMNISNIGDIVTFSFDDNVGEPGSVIGQKTIMHSDISSSSLGNVGTNKDYNAIAIFDTPIEIPSNEIFYVTVGLTY